MKQATLLCDKRAIVGWHQIWYTNILVQSARNCGVRNRISVILLYGGSFHQFPPLLASISSEAPATVTQLESQPQQNYGEATTVITILLNLGSGLNFGSNLTKIYWTKHWSSSRFGGSVQPNFWSLSSSREAGRLCEANIHPVKENDISFISYRWTLAKLTSLRLSKTEVLHERLSYHSTDHPTYSWKLAWCNLLPWLPIYC